MTATPPDDPLEPTVGDWLSGLELRAATEPAPPAGASLPGAFGFGRPIAPDERREREIASRANRLPGLFEAFGLGLDVPPGVSREQVWAPVIERAIRTQRALASQSHPAEEDLWAALCLRMMETFDEPSGDAGAAPGRPETPIENLRHVHDLVEGLRDSRGLTISAAARHLVRHTGELRHMSAVNVRTQHREYKRRALAQFDFAEWAAAFSADQEDSAET